MWVMGGQKAVSKCISSDLKHGQEFTALPRRMTLLSPQPTYAPVSSCVNGGDKQLVPGTQMVLNKCTHYSTGVSQAQGEQHSL